MTTENSVCFYGLRVGCPSASNPNCRTCADRLTHAVNEMLRSTGRSARISKNATEPLIDEASERLTKKWRVDQLRDRAQLNFALLTARTRLATLRERTLASSLSERDILRWLGGR